MCIYFLPTDHDVMAQQESCHFAKPIPESPGQTKTIRTCIKDNCNGNFPFHVEALDGTCQNDANGKGGDNYRCCTSCKQRKHLSNLSKSLYCNRRNKRLYTLFWKMNDLTRASDRMLIFNLKVFGSREMRN